MAVINKDSQATFVMLENKIKQNQVVAPLVTDLSSSVEKGHDSVKINVVLPMTAQVQTVGAVNFTNQNVSYNQDVMLLNAVSGSSFQIDVHLEMENLFDNEANSIAGILTAMGLTLENQLIAQALAAATLTETARTADIYNDVIAAKRVMRDALIPLEGMSLVLNGADEAAAATSSKIINSTDTQNRTGFAGKIAGFDCFVSNSAAATESFFIHKDGAAYAWHGDIVYLESVSPQTTKKTASLSRKFNSTVLRGGALIYKWGES
jgi:hypothetical protein